MSVKGLNYAAAKTVERANLGPGGGGGGGGRAFETGRASVGRWREL